MAKMLISLLVLLCLPTGCGSLLRPGLHSNVSGTGDLDIALWVDRTEGKVGEPVHITFTVVYTDRYNTHKAEIIKLTSRPVMDIRVGYATDDFARWSDLQPADQDLRRLVLEPGESRTIEMTWVPDKRTRNLPVLIQGILNWADDRSADAPVTFPVEYVPPR